MGQLLENDIIFGMISIAQQVILCLIICMKQYEIPRYKDIGIQE